MYTSNPPNVHGWSQQASPANRPISDFQGGRDQLRAFIVPAWIHRAFARKYSLGEIHDYGKVRQVASLQDIGALVVTNCFLTQEKEVRNGSRHEPHMHSFFKVKNFEDRAMNQPVLTDEQYSEYKASVTLYEQDESFRRTVMARYRDTDSNAPECVEAFSAAFVSGTSLGIDPKSLGYRIEFVNDSLYIIVEEGFLSRISGKAARLSFFQQVLKAAYAALPISTVNLSVWYRNYVHALQQASL